MSTKNAHYRPQGRKLTAMDLAERLLPDLDMNELLIWSPDLFAFTSYILSHTGAYQLVISPPTGKSWKPTNKEIKEWLGLDTSLTDKIGVSVMQENIERWIRSIVEKRQSSNNSRKPERRLAERRKNTDPDYENNVNGKYDRRRCKDIKALAAKVTKDVESCLRNTTFSKDDEGKILKEKYEKELARLETELKNISPNSDSTEIIEESKIQKKRILEITVGNVSLYKLFTNDNECNWVEFVQKIGDEWKQNLNQISHDHFYIVNDAELDEKGVQYRDDQNTPIQWKSDEFERFTNEAGSKIREKEVFDILFKYTPPLLIACWAYFCNEISDKNFYSNGFKREMEISDLLCNQDEIQVNQVLKDKLWKVAQALLTMHAISDICCTRWGITAKDDQNKKAQWFAEKLLFDKGSLATINPERGRVMPKRHNPGVGITLRSISSNLGFHRSSVEVVWRKTCETPLEKRLDENDSKTLSMLLLPFPLDVKAKDFGEDKLARKRVELPDNYGFFEYNPKNPSIEVTNIVKLIKNANDEFADGSRDKVDIIVFPEGALSKKEYHDLAEALERLPDPPSLFIAGVRESRCDVWEGIPCAIQESLIKENCKNWDEINKKRKTLTEDEKTNAREISKTNNELAEEIINFSRNALYCQYLNICDLRDNKASYYRTPNLNERDRYQFTPKYKQYKHHRWQLDKFQIERYGLSSILSDKEIWWESMKVPKRRVSFLNVGDKLTVSHLVCEDLARQDPISDLIRHVGPSLVVTLLMDGPQLKNRWSHRYASVLSDDPGCSVITLTSWGMTKRHSSTYGLMSKVIGLWSESKNSKTREIELADGAQAVLLTLKIDKEAEKTADGRMEREADKTSVLRLVDVIQIYP